AGGRQGVGLVQERDGAGAGLKRGAVAQPRLQTEGGAQVVEGDGGEGRDADVRRGGDLRQRRRGQGAGGGAAVGRGGGAVGGAGEAVEAAGAEHAGRDGDGGGRQGAVFQGLQPDAAAFPARARPPLGPLRNLLAGREAERAEPAEQRHGTVSFRR